MYTPLHYACVVGSLESASILINQNAEVNAFSRNYNTPLHLAAKHNHSLLIELLLQNGAKINSRDSNGRNPLMIAAKYGSLESIKALLKTADIYEVDMRKWTCLHYACFHKQVKVVAELVTRDADKGKLVQMKNSQSKTAYEITSDAASKEAFNTIWAAAAKGDMDLARRLIRRGDDVNRPSVHEYETPLIFCVKSFELFKRKTLTEAQKIKDVGKTAFLRVKNQKDIDEFRRKQILMLRFLIDLGARCEDLDRYGKSAIDHTSDEKIKEILQGKMGIQSSTINQTVINHDYSKITTDYTIKTTTNVKIENKTYQDPTTKLSVQERSNFNKLAKVAEDEYAEDFEEEVSPPQKIKEKSNFQDPFTNSRNQDNALAPSENKSDFPAFKRNPPLRDNSKELSDF